VTHVVSLAAVAMVVLLVLVALSAPNGAYALLTLFWGGTTGALILFPQLGLEKEHLREYVMARWVARQIRRFDPDLPPQALEGKDAGTENHEVDDLEQRRKKEYESNRGLFLGHYWWPSEKENQVANLEIRLRDHPDPDDGPTPLEAGKVDSVTYQLGPKFSEGRITKDNPADNFALEVSAHGPMLCLAVVAFNDGTPDLYLSRYIDFPEDL
jgi:hypothetical protein